MKGATVKTGLSKQEKIEKKDRGQDTSASKQRPQQPNSSVKTDRGSFTFG